MTIKILFFFTIITYCIAANDNAPSISGEFVARWDLDIDNETSHSHFFVAWSPQANRYRYQLEYPDTEDGILTYSTTSKVGDFNSVINYDLETLIKLILELYN